MSRARGRWESYIDENAVCGDDDCECRSGGMSPVLVLAVLVVVAFFTATPSSLAAFLSSSTETSSVFSSDDGAA
jgi:hypothetical protein